MVLLPYVKRAELYTGDSESTHVIYIIWSTDL